MTVLRGATDTFDIVKAIRSGKTVLLFRLSELDSSCRDIHILMPTLLECEKYLQLLKYKPHLKADLELTLAEEYMFFEDEKIWIFTDAPAGILTSVIDAVLELGMPRGLENIHLMLDVSRNVQTVYGQMKELLVTVGIDITNTKDMDVFEFYNLVAYSEAKMKREGVISKPIAFETAKEDAPKNDSVGYINVDEFNNAYNGT